MDDNDIAFPAEQPMPEDEVQPQEVNEEVEIPRDPPVVYPIKDVFSVCVGSTYYFDLELGSQKEIEVRDVLVQPDPVVVLVEESKSYMIHVTTNDHIIFSSHQNYDKETEFSMPAFVIVKCFSNETSQLAQTEFTLPGDEFNLVLLSNRLIKLILIDEDMIDEEMMDEDNIQLIEMQPGEQIAINQALGIAYEFFCEIDSPYGYYPAIVDVTARGQMRECRDYVHEVKWNNVQVKAGHTYNVSVLPGTDRLIAYVVDEQFNLNPYFVNVNSGDNYIIYMKPLDVYVVVGNEHFTETGDVINMAANVTIKGILDNEEKEVVLNPDETLQLYTTSTIHAIRIDSDPEDSTRETIQIEPGYSYNISLMLNRVYTLQAIFPDGFGRAWNPAFITLSTA